MDFMDCRFDNNSGAGITGDNFMHFNNCQADNNMGKGFDSDVSPSFVKCVAFSNGDTGIYDASGGSKFISCLSYENTASQARGSTRVAVWNCTFDGGGSAVCLELIGYENTVSNCIFYDGTTGLLAENQYQLSHYSSTNLFYENDTDATNWNTDPSDIFADPLFVDADNNDYRLQVTSPALKAGIDAGELTNETSYIDIGAQQYEEPVQLLGLQIT